MIEVHVFNAFMLTELRDTAWFKALNFVNGLVAPSFLFVSGFVFILASKRKVEDFRTYGKNFWRQLGRIFQIWVIGYFLHLPFFSLQKTVNEASPKHWLIFFQADVLHCIALGLIFLFLSFLLIKSEKKYFNWLWFSGIFTVIVSPFIWDIDFTQFIHPFFAAYINGQHYSLFPIFPWLAFMIFGGLCSSFYLQARESDTEKEFMKKLILIGGILIAVGSLFMLVPIEASFYSSHIRPDPFFFAQRFGIVLILLAACWYYANWRQTEKSFVLDVSRESLLVYVAHLLIIYGLFFNGKSLANFYGETFSVPESAFWTLVLITLMILAAKLWGALKSYSIKTARYISIAAGLLIIVIFILK